VSSEEPELRRRGDELALALDPDEREVRREQTSRQQRCAGSKRHGGDTQLDLVEEPAVGQLTREISASDDPDVPVAGDLDHLGVHRPRFPLHEPQVGVGDRGQLPVREHPAGGVAVVLPPLLGMIEQLLVLEDPLVGRRTHRHRPDLTEESGE
jgi:hypothetical protein